MDRQQLERWAREAGLAPLPIVLDSTPSTNDEAKALALAGASHGTSVLADTQQAGRGRLGRSWVSPPGQNLYASLVLRPQMPAERVPLLCLGAAVAVAEVCGEGFRIKWPNDVVDTAHRKVAGILAEAEWSGGQPAFIVLGIGLNVGSHPDGLPATSLAAHGDRRSREELAAALLAETLRQVERVVSEPEALLQDWRARSATLGAKVAVGSVTGTAVGLDDSGALLVDTGEGMPTRILAGDVSMVS